MANFPISRRVLHGACFLMGALALSQPALGEVYGNGLHRCGADRLRVPHFLSDCSQVAEVKRASEIRPDEETWMNPGSDPIIADWSYIGEPSETLKQLDVTFGKLQAVKNVHPEWRGILKGIMLAEDDVNAGKFAAARKRVQAIFSQYPQGDPIWDELYADSYRIFDKLGTKIVPRSGYYGLRMLDEITRVALNSPPKPSTTLNVTVALMRYARYPIPPQNGGGIVTIEIDQSTKTNNYHAYRKCFSLFSHYLWAITDGELKVNLRFYEIQKPMDLTYNAKTNEMIWDDGYPEFAVQLPQQIRDSTDQFFGFYPDPPTTDPRFRGVKWNLAGNGGGGGQGTFDTFPHHRALMFGNEGEYNYGDEMTQRTYGAEWSQHEFFHHLFGNLFSEYKLEETDHQWFWAENWPKDFVMGNEADYYAESLEKRLRGSFPSIATRLKAAPSRRMLTSNSAPAVDAGPDLSVPLTATLNGTVADADNNPLVISWSLISGPDSVTFGDSTTASTTAKFRKAGTYRLRLTADDGLSQTHDEMVVTVPSSLPTVQWTVASQVVPNESSKITVTARLSATSRREITVPFTLAGTAKLGKDYTVSADSITIPAGARSGSVKISIRRDVLDERNETVIFTMKKPKNATLGARLKHTATILDDDG